MDYQSEYFVSVEKNDGACILVWANTQRRTRYCSAKFKQIIIGALTGCVTQIQCCTFTNKARTLRQFSPFLFF